jgi:AraC-like DNA-binding protein
MATAAAPSSTVPVGSAIAEWRPAHLAGLVDLIWYYRGPTVNTLKRILPTGRLELVVNLGEPYQLVSGAGTERLASCWISGLQAGPMVVAQPARQDVVGVRLRPAGAQALLSDTPLRVVSGLHVALRDLVGRAAEELRERLAEATTVERRLRLAARWVGDRIVRAGGLDPAVAWTAARIERSRGAVSIGALRQRTGLSKARMVLAFREQIGVAPKLYARTLRFGRTAELLQGGAGRLAEVALTAGYYDQPHMNAEFRELSGLTPREFLARRHPMGDGTTVAEPAR